MRSKYFITIFLVIFSLSLFSCGDENTGSDTEPPEIELTDPVDNSEFDQGTLITITAEASDNEEIERVEFYIDDTEISSDNESPYNYELDTSGTLGEHTIYAKAYDTNGNNSISDVVTIIINEEPDVLKLIIDPSIQTIQTDSNASLSVRLEDAVDVFAFSGEIVFDSTLVVFQNIEKGSFWDGHESLIEFIEEPGCLNVCVGLTQSAQVEGIDGGGQLFNFEVKGINIGQSNISFENIQLIDEESNLIENFDSIIYEEGILVIE